MIRINQIKMNLADGEDRLKEKAASILKLRLSDICSVKIVKKSIDARHKPDIKYVYSVNVTVANEKKINKRVLNNNIFFTEEKKYTMPKAGSEKLCARPVIVGMGPAGLFCGYFLAKAGYEPVIIERGECVENRKKTVESFWNGGKLNTESNVQFGEGGAGTFSDGKLNTVVKDKDGKHTKVLETFVKFGAKEEITYVNKPHIGTDILCDIVKNMRQEIIRLGGQIKFNTKLTDINAENGEIKSVNVMNTERKTVNNSIDSNSDDNTINKNIENIDCQVLVLALGHSARDTFEMLNEKKLHMEPKAFAVGVRVEHPQSMINKKMYGTEAHELLEAADYKVTYNTPNERGVYSFCMCPGGYVVNASSEEKRLAVNGMSYSGRDGSNANSAIIVTVTPKDYGQTSSLDGMYFQRRLEEKAYAEGKGAVPVQRFEDFEKNRCTENLGRVKPMIKGEYRLSNLRNIFPEYITDSLIEGMHGFSRQIEDFDIPDALLSGVESRTSSPVRINRDDKFEANIKGIYPCGEGAGYAGGITSAAMDGMRVFEAIMSKYSPLRKE